MKRSHTTIQAFEAFIILVCLTFSSCHTYVHFLNTSVRVSKCPQLTPTDIFLSHDWPNTIEQHGDLQSLLRRKPFFRQETQTGSLGSPPLLDLLKKIKPQWWFSAHLHTKFEALYRHNGKPPKPLGNPDEILLDDLEEDGGSKPIDNPDEIKIDDDEDFDVENSALTKSMEPVIASTPEKALTVASVRETRFLALDKCLPKRDFLQVRMLDGLCSDRGSSTW